MLYFKIIILKAITINKFKVTSKKIKQNNLIKTNNNNCKIYKIIIIMLIINSINGIIKI